MECIQAITSTNDSIAAWANHVDGAVALAKLRGVEEYQHPTSIGIFRAVRTMMLTSCVQQSKPVDDFPGPEGWMSVGGSDENAANRLTVLSLQLPEIRARSKALQNRHRNPAAMLEALALLNDALRVDADLEQWARTLPDAWGYKTVSWKHDMPDDLANAPQYPGPKHVYEDTFIANIMNDYRVSRIFCQSVVLSCTTWLSPPGEDLSTESQCLVARHIIQQMVDDICASVPFHMDYSLQSKARSMGQDEAAAEALGGYFLVWPVFVALNTECVPRQQREWLQGRLSHIGYTFGLNQAQVLLLARRHVLTCGPVFP
ncbi:hypothetical protein H2199_000655 [Coniosporium tulheliwenetii]|uniref:Uncharacterized protein n=1 Tax=Coniosporium tulheliwenetii TaxID=3383036 RepID=A0ACC2ZMC0_9PEZI|nr:hypothetical protein H2199_000655 [Cladosporium sp. JES 115]